MREVRGFLTKDGAFYEGQNEAELHEAEKELLRAYEDFVGKGNFARFANVVTNLRDEVRRFLDAQIALENAGAPIEDASAVSQHYPDDGLGQAFETNEQQQVGGFGDLSNMGLSSLAETLRSDRSEHGARMRGDDA